jgi:hypothetical protein
MMEIRGDFVGDGLFRNRHGCILHFPVAFIHREFLMNFHQFSGIVVNFLPETYGYNAPTSWIARSHPNDTAVRRRPNPPNGRTSFHFGGVNSRFTSSFCGLIFAKSAAIAKIPFRPKPKDAWRTFAVPEHFKHENWIGGHVGTGVAWGYGHAGGKWLLPVRQLLWTAVTCLRFQSADMSAHSKTP